MVLLQWVLGLAVLVEAGGFAFLSSEARAFSRAGFPNWLRLVLAWGEILGAVLFLIPRTLLAGGSLLLLLFLSAALVHILHGWWNVSSLLVFAAAAYAILRQERQRL
jgi:hypothetical protein